MSDISNSDNFEYDSDGDVIMKDAKKSRFDDSMEQAVYDNNNNNNSEFEFNGKFKFNANNNFNNQNSTNFNNQNTTFNNHNATSFFDIPNIEPIKNSDHGTPSAPEYNEMSKCIICYVNTKNTVVYPCRHKVVCSECSDSLHKMKNFKSTCIYCKQKIEKIFYLDGSKKIINISPHDKLNPYIKKCLICDDNPANTVVDPCGCIVLCECCSDKIVNTKLSNECLNCSDTIQRIIFVSSGKEVNIKHD